MSLRSRLSEIERKLAPRDFLTIFVRGVLHNFVGTDPMDEKSNSSPRPGESLEAFIDRVRDDAIRAGKSHVAIFGIPHDYDGRKPYLRDQNRLQ
jgi:hypothetical protein